MGFRQGRHAPSRRARPTAFIPALIFSTLLPFFAAGLIIGQAQAEEEVECSSLRLEMSDGAYDNSCYVYNGVMGATEVLESNASDGSHFLVVADRTAKYGYIFVSGISFRTDIADSFDLTISEWRSGSPQQGLKTAEFVSDMKSIPSECVAFERNLRKEYNGWRRRIIGFGCTRTGDREAVYAAMRDVNFPE